MKQIIVIHGAPDQEEFYDVNAPSSSNAVWIPWLQKQIAIKDDLCQAPEFPKPYDPIYAGWVSVIENFKIDSETILIGHSCGGGFLLRYFSEHAEISPKLLVLVAPWIDPNHELTTPFFDFEIDPKLSERTKIEVFISRDDGEVMQKTFQIVQEKIPGIIVHQFEDKGHFCQKDFPELLEVLKEKTIPFLMQERGW